MLDAKVNYVLNGATYSLRMESLGSRIKALRTLHNMSLADVGAFCEVSAQAVNQWEDGATKDIKLEPFLKLCTLFAIDPYDLVFGEQNKPTPPRGGMVRRR